MATLLLPPPQDMTPSAPAGTAELVILLTPIRGADGKLRVQRGPIPAGQTVTASLPPKQDWGKVILNGGVLPPEAWATWIVQPDDEVLAIPAWGVVEGLLGYLIIAGIGLAVSLAVTGITYLLFPPAKPHMQGRTEEPTSSWEGIRTTVGPGGVVPVVYGKHRIGGQLLSAAVDETLTVIDNGVSPRQITAIAEPSTLTLVLALCEGPIHSVMNETIELNGQPIANFPSVQVFTVLGTPDQAPLPFFNETRNTFADGRVMDVDVALGYTTTQAVHAFTLNIVFQEGLFFMSRHGEKENNTVFLRYRYRITQPGDTGWVGWSEYRIDASRTVPVRFGIRREQLELAIYEIEVAFGNVWNSDETRSKWVPTLHSVSEAQNTLSAYANTALLMLRSVATDALQGDPNVNVTVIINGKLVRAATLDPALLTWTDNHAWGVMDAMTNTRYGMGIDDAEIDLNAFALWALYNEETTPGERRHTFNYVLDREIRSQPFLLETMGGSRTMLIKSGGLWQPRPTRDEPPTQLLTWTNCTNLLLTYTRDLERINVMESRYANEDNGYQQDVVTWPLVESWPAEVRKASLEMRGVTKSSRVIRALQFELNRRRFENITLSMDCSLEAITFSVHDLFRFSHPLAGWGVSGRLQPQSTAAILRLDEDVTLVGGASYVIHVRHADDTVDIKPVVNVGGAGLRQLTLAVPLTQTPIPRESVWALGRVVGDSTGVRVFRATKVQRKSDTTVHIEAVIHNSSMYDEADALPLPVITTLFNPLGPSPPLTSLVLTEVLRIQPSGASLRVVHAGWDVAGLNTGYAPYGGALILRRTVTAGSGAGVALAGQTSFGTLQDGSDANVNYVLLTRVTGHTLDYDDYTVVTGGSYVYRVIPVSQRGVPNNLGALEAAIHVAGPTTADYFPGTVRNLRLKGQAVGATSWEGKDVHLEWDAVADSPLFNDTFFVQDYLIQVWAPGQEYLLRHIAVRATPPGQSITYTYTYEQNSEDQVATGHPGARRDLWFYVWARTNTNRQSLDPAILKVSNPPPDMSEIMPDTTGLFTAALINWNQWIEPRDFSHYTVYLDTQNPPLAIYQDVAIAFRKLFPANLLQDVQYWVYILPWDTFGAGVPSGTATFTPVALTADFLDTTAPGPVTGFSLSTGTEISQDGTIMPWVQASWTRNPESDIAGYEVQYRIAPSPVPTVFNPLAEDTAIRIPVPGGVTVLVKMLAFDRFHNASAFTTELSIVSGIDTVAPAAPTNLTAIGSIRAVALLWTPPSDADYARANVWSATVNNRASAVVVGSGQFSYTHEGLGAIDTRYYWLQSQDWSGNLSAAFHPASATAGIPGTAGQLDTTFISSLAANKIIAGTINALVRIGVANQIDLDGVNQVITMRDALGTVRGQFGRLGALTTDWGLRLFNQAGQVMWNFTDGANSNGIANSAITAQKISAAVITATHLRTDTAVITVAAQIANALIGDAHITNLSASKIIAGTLQANVSIGVGSEIFIDGPGARILVTDNQSTRQTRIIFGKLGAALADYGMQIFSPDGSLMWSHLSGATTPGITPNAVSDSLVFTDIAGASGYTSIFETEIGGITFPLLETGDRVLVSGSATGFAVAGGAVFMILREDSAGGTFHHRSNLGTPPAGATGPADSMGALAVQTVYVAPSTQVNKRFVLTISVRAPGPGAIFDTKLAGTRIKR